jgi:hypothetical protein
MNTIIIEKEKLLPIVLENRQKHDNIYAAAVSGYWVKAEEILTDKLTKVKKQEKIEDSLGLTYPINYSDDYDRVIRMLELTSENQLTLTTKEFDSYVRNQWGWKHSFLGTNSCYISGFSPVTGSYLINNF